MEHNIEIKDKKIDYLRLSLTDRCNLNCCYCTPLEKGQFFTREEVLRYEEMVRLLSLFVKIGVRKLRITGGEPLLKKDIAELIKMLKAVEGLAEIAMTTNAVYLEGLAGRLKQAGLDRLNVSIDTLRKERFAAITGCDYFEQVWSGIRSAIDTGFHPLKLNVVVMKGINDDEIADFARLTLAYPVIVRFIEFFPVNKRSLRLSERLLTTDKIMEQITARIGALEETGGVSGNGPAAYFKIQGTNGIVGFISSYSRDFCGECTRIRMDCAGRISPCLFSGPTHDVRSLLRSGKDDAALERYIKGVLALKPEYKKYRGENAYSVEMSSIGG